jgi:hypothetical protein
MPRIRSTTKPAIKMTITITIGTHIFFTVFATGILANPITFR